MNNLFYQTLLNKEFLSVISKTDEVELNVGLAKEETLCTITPLEAVKELFEIGFDINTWVTTEIFNEPKTNTTIEEAIFYAEDKHILKLCLSHLDTSFFQNLKYKNQCSIVEALLEKSLTPSNKKELLSTLFDKGFKVRQLDINSKELEWLEQGHIEFFEVLLEKDSSFKWNYLYNAKYSSDEPVTLISSIENALTDIKNSSYSSSNREQKQLKLQKLKEKINTICQHEKLSNDLPLSSEPHRKPKI